MRPFDWNGCMIGLPEAKLILDMDGPEGSPNYFEMLEGAAPVQLSLGPEPLPGRPVSHVLSGVEGV